MMLSEQLGPEILGPQTQWFKLQKIMNFFTLMFLFSSKNLFSSKCDKK